MCGRLIGAHYLQLGSSYMAGASIKDSAAIVYDHTLVNVVLCSAEDRCPLECPSNPVGSPLVRYGEAQHPNNPRAVRRD
jgi:hypothetical protein